MKKLLLVLSSVRKGRAADNILTQIQHQLEQYPNFEVQIADFGKLPLPFFDNPDTPSSEDFTTDNENVQTWAQMVKDADTVVFVVAEYNYSYTPVLKNAIDWLFTEWKDKPVSFIGYGWAGGSRAIKHLRDVMASTIAARPLEVEANLRFMKEINLDGTAANDDAASALKTVLETL